MSAPVETITVILRQTVLTQMGVLTALVMQDTVVMASAVMVNKCLVMIKLMGTYLSKFSDIFDNILG